MRETRIQTCKTCSGSGEEVDLTQPDGVRDCRDCPHSVGVRRVPITREPELVAV